MRAILAKTNTDPESLAKRREKGKSQENVERLRRIAEERTNWKPDKTLHIIGSRQFRGPQRAKAWSLIRDGMTLREWFGACEASGVDPRKARNELFKFVYDFHIAEVR